MRKLLPFLITLMLTLMLAGCSPVPSSDEATPPSSPAIVGLREANAELARLRAQGDEKTAREITSLEYPAYRELMKASGLDAALGGDAKADAALRELLAGYERKTRSLQNEMPKMLPMAYGGIEIGYSGFAVSMMTGMLQNQAAVELSQRGDKEGQPSGGYSQSVEGSKVDVQWSQSHTASTSEFEGAFPGGMKGKLSTKVEVDTCPDASGKINVEFTSNSELRSTTSPGTGGSVKVIARLAKYLDDDAHLIDDRMDSDVHVEQSAFGNDNGSFVDLTQTLSTTRSEMGTKVNRRSQAATDASVQAAEGLAKLGMLAAMQALDAAKKAWESGQCVKLDATSSPSKRKGIKPNTAFDLEAKPRAKSDGAPAGGTVVATLSGGSSLQPASGKVPADAKYAYVGPAKKKEEAAIEFEARSKRGVGRATLEFDTKDGAYRIKGAQNDFFANVVVCSLTGPFDIKSTVGIVMHMSGGESGGSWTQSGHAAGVAWSGGGNYTLQLGEDGSGSLKAKGMAIIASPMGRFSDSVQPAFSVTPVDEACE